MTSDEVECPTCFRPSLEPSQFEGYTAQCRYCGARYTKGDLDILGFTRREMETLNDMLSIYSVKEEL